jgi:hypothetical protein
MPGGAPGWAAKAGPRVQFSDCRSSFQIGGIAGAIQRQQPPPGLIRHPRNAASGVVMFAYLPVNSTDHSLQFQCVSGYRRGAKQSRRIAYAWPM